MSYTLPLSILYKEPIAHACHKLLQLEISHCILCLFFNDGSTFRLSNTFPLLESAYEKALYDDTEPFALNRLKEVGNINFLAQEACAISPHFKQWCYSQTNLYPIYNLIRRHAECTFVLGAFRSQPVESELLFYGQTIKAFAVFCAQFINEFLDLIIQSHPAYRFSFILSNKRLREAVIMGTQHDTIHLSLREKECLLLAAQGQKAKSIAKTLNISPNTVEQYFKHARKVLKCNTVTHAVCESINRGLIGRVVMTTENKK